MTLNKARSDVTNDINIQYFPGILSQDNITISIYILIRTKFIITRVSTKRSDNPLSEMCRQFL